MSSNVERNNKKILPNLKRFFTSIQSRNLIKKTFLSFVQHLKRFRRKKEHTLEFRRENTEPEGFASSLFRCCTKLKKVFLIRFRDCIEVKNLFRFGRIFLLFLSTFELIWKLLTSTEPFLVGSAKTLFFLECGTYAFAREKSTIDNFASNDWYSKKLRRFIYRGNEFTTPV